MDCAKRSIGAYNYERHCPEKSLLHQVVAKNLEPFVKKCEESGHPVPKFVRREFEAFLRCGVLSYGFARVYCQSCKYDRLVAFSCKKRGFCGSCLARRMSDTACRLTDEVIPEIPTRQWVLSLPHSASLFGGLRQRCPSGGDIGIYGSALCLPSSKGQKLRRESP